MGEDTRSAHGDESKEYTREELLEFLDEMGPLGIDYISHFTHMAGWNYENFIATCRDFGLVHHLMLINDTEIEDAIKARKERGAAPRPLTDAISHMLHYDTREDVDARLDVYARRVAEAEAQIAEGTYRWMGDPESQAWLAQENAAAAANAAGIKARREELARSWRLEARRRATSPDACD